MKTLEKLLETDRRLSEESARLYIAQIVHQIADLHESSLIYNSLHPHNIYVDEKGQVRLKPMAEVASGQVPLSY